METITITFPGLSLNEVCKQNPELFYNQSWYTEEAFANEKIPAGEWTVSLEAVPDSLSKTWEEQQKLLDEELTVPPIAVLVYAMVEHFKDTGNRAFGDVYVRTSSLDSDGDRVRVGDFDAGGLVVDYDWDGRRGSSLGLASAWKEPRTLESLKSLEGLSLEARVAKIEAVLEHFNLKI